MVDPWNLQSTRYLSRRTADRFENTAGPQSYVITLTLILVSLVFLFGIYILLAPVGEIVHPFTREKVTNLQLFSLTSLLGNCFCLMSHFVMRRQILVPRTLSDQLARHLKNYTFWHETFVHFSLLIDRPTSLHLAAVSTGYQIRSNSDNSENDIPCHIAEMDGPQIWMICE